jgi:hypothetical protein
MPRTLKSSCVVRLHRRLGRRLNGFTTVPLSGRRRLLTPNYWNSAVRCLTRAARAHRRLIKLAPERFDYGIVKHRQAQQEKDRPVQERMEAALVKVYGPEASATYRRTLQAQTPAPPRSKATQRAIERELGNRQRWLEAGREAMTLFRRHHQWSRVGLIGIVRMLEVGHTLGRLSTGLETTWKEEPSPTAGYLDFEAALEKIYGKTQGGTATPHIPSPLAGRGSG